MKVTIGESSYLKKLRESQKEVMSVIRDHEVRKQREILNESVTSLQSHRRTASEPLKEEDLYIPSSSSSSSLIKGKGTLMTTISHVNPFKKVKLNKNLKLKPSYLQDINGGTSQQSFLPTLDIKANTRYLGIQEEDDVVFLPHDSDLSKSFIDLKASQSQFGTI